MTVGFFRRIDTDIILIGDVNTTDHCLDCQVRDWIVGKLSATISRIVRKTYMNAGKLISENCNTLVEKTCQAVKETS